MTVDRAGDAEPGVYLESLALRLAGEQAALFRVGDDRGGERVFRVMFGRGCERQQIVRFLTPDSQWQHVGERGSACGDGAGFVEHDGVHVPGLFQCFGGADQHAHVRRAACGDHYR